jgi:uncharacterized protein
MGFSLFPRTVKFFDLFMEQNRKLRKAATVLHELFDDFVDVEEKCAQINIIEADGNFITRMIAKELSSTFITPIDREDIHQINVTQESILNLIKAVSTRMWVYDMAEVRYPSKRLTGILRDMVEEAGEVLDRLSRNKQAEKSIEKIKSLRYESEMLLTVGLGEIYDTASSGADILDVVKWDHLYDRIEHAVARAEALADILEGIMLKNA